MAFGLRGKAKQSPGTTNRSTWCRSWWPWLQLENSNNESNFSPIENGDFPFCHLSFREGMMLLFLGLYDLVMLIQRIIRLHTAVSQTWMINGGLHYHMACDIQCSIGAMKKHIYEESYPIIGKGSYERVL